MIDVVLTTISSIHTTYHDDNASVLISIASVSKLAKHYNRHTLISIHREHSSC